MIALLAGVIGVLAGSLVTGWVLPDPAPAATVQMVDEELTLGDTEASKPSQVSIYEPSPTRTACIDVPELLFEESRPAQDSLQNASERRTPNALASLQSRAATPTGPTLQGLTQLARSRTPFLYLPLTKQGRPTVDNDAAGTTVYAWGADGRGFTFHYPHKPPDVRLYVTAGVTALWWPPTATSSHELLMSARAGAELYGLELEAGPAYSTELGPAVAFQVGVTPWTLTF